MLGWRGHGPQRRRRGPPPFPERPPLSGRTFLASGAAKGKRPALRGTSVAVRRLAARTAISVRGEADLLPSRAHGGHHAGAGPHGADAGRTPRAHPLPPWG